MSIKLCIYIYAYQQDRVSHHFEILLTRIHHKKRETKIGLAEQFCPCWRLMRGDSEHQRMYVYRRIENHASLTRTLTVVLEGLTGCRQKKMRRRRTIKTEFVSQLKISTTILSMSIDSTRARAHKFTLDIETHIMDVDIFASVSSDFFCLFFLCIYKREIFNKMTISYKGEFHKLKGKCFANRRKRFITEIIRRNWEVVITYFSILRWNF